MPPTSARSSPCRSPGLPRPSLDPSSPPPSQTIVVSNPGAHRPSLALLAPVAASPKNVGRTASTVGNRPYASAPPPCSVGVRRTRVWFEAEWSHPPSAGRHRAADRRSPRAAEEPGNRGRGDHVGAGTRPARAWHCAPSPQQSVRRGHSREELPPTIFRALRFNGGHLFPARRGGASRGSIVAKTASNPPRLAFKASLKDFRPATWPPRDPGASKVPDGPGFDRHLMVGCADPEATGPQLARLLASTRLSQPPHHCHRSAPRRRRRGWRCTDQAGVRHLTLGCRVFSRYPASSRGRRARDFHNRCSPPQARTERPRRPNDAWRDPREDGSSPSASRWPAADNLAPSRASPARTRTSSWRSRTLAEKAIANLLRPRSTP